MSILLLALTIGYFSEKDPPTDTATTYWGVDSAENAQDNLYACVTDRFGTPDVFGRYLSDKEDVSSGLTKKEVSFLHDQDVHILVIYNHVTDATSEDAGIEHAEQAIDLANDLDIPEGVALFVDIEPDYAIDAAFLNGWYTTIRDADYEMGVYGVFKDDSELMDAFHDTKEDVQENSIVWTAYPQKEISSKDKAPIYEPQGPKDANVYGWQYAIDADDCTIDTNLFSAEMLDFLWKY